MDERTRQSINKQTHRSTQSTNNEDPIIHHYPTPKFPPTGVRYNRYERDRTISFVPPDGQFELMRYRVTPKAAQIIPPIYCSMQVGKLTRLGWWWCYSLCVCVCRVHYLRMYVYRSISCIMTTPPLHARLFPSPIHIISPPKKKSDRVQRGGRHDARARDADAGVQADKQPRRDEPGQEARDEKGATKI